MQLDFTRPGTPTDKGHIEAFNGRLRGECLNVRQFQSLADVQQKIEAWYYDNNQVRPHGALRHLTPSEVAAQGQEQGSTEAPPL
jgi:putative transposase